VVLGILIVKVSRSHSDTPRSVRLPSKSDRPILKTSDKTQRDRHLCSRWDSNPQSQQARDRRSTPWITYD